MSLLPPARAEILALDNNVSVHALELIDNGPRLEVRLRANLIRPIQLDRTTIYPLGWHSQTIGWYQIHLNARGVLQAPVLFLVITFAWPYRGRRDFVGRTIAALPLAWLVFAVDTPLELLGNFQQAVLHGLEPSRTAPLFVWDRLLEGGGNCAIAIAAALIAVGFGRKAAARGK